MKLDKYIYSHCMYPKKVRVWDALEQCYVYREVPCGSCLHCRITKMSEWNTRLNAAALYHTNLYFITLDYAPFDLRVPAARQLARETGATYNDLNINSNYGMQPLVLRKDHLSDFFKRLRKNTGHTFQHFACGEYGSCWSRPHFHIIIFSNDTFFPQDFERAWTVNGYQIGRVDFNDLRANGTMSRNSKKKNKYNQKYVFNYVCKYLQKEKAKFEKMSTYNYHKLFCKCLNTKVQDADTLFPLEIPIADIEIDKDDWKSYCKLFAPFISCSRRPALGLQYFQEHRTRFEAQDFRLFGLPEECSIFPRYFLRKTKETASRFVALGSISQSPTTISRMPYIKSLLTEILDHSAPILSWTDRYAYIWNINKTCLTYSPAEYKMQSRYLRESSIQFKDLNFYDRKLSLMYIFNGLTYDVWAKYNRIGFVKIHDMSIPKVINLISGNIQKFEDDFLIPFKELREFHNKELCDCLHDKFDNNYEKFRDYCYDIYNNELKRNRRFDIEYNNSHLTF